MCIKLINDLQAERKPRKSVAFEDNTTIVDGDGQVLESGEMNGEKNSAESHSAGTSSAISLSTPAIPEMGSDRAMENPADAKITDKEVDEVSEMLAGLAKKVYPSSMRCQVDPLTSL